MYDFTKSLDENQKLVRDYATTVATAAFDFNKKVMEASTEAFYAMRDQAVEAAKTAGIKVPGLDK